MVQNNLLPVDADAHLLGHVLEPVHEALLCILHIVIPKNKVYLPIESVINGHPFPPPPEGEIAQMKDRPILRDHFIPVADQCLIHLFD